MNRITQKFQELKIRRKTAFMPFIVAGDPNFKTSLDIVKTITKSADLLEIGFPYSDPLADGPTIQAANQRALKAGMNTDRVFEFVREIRTSSKIPITVLVYANLVYQKGIERFYRIAKQVGVDGVLVPDLPAEESIPYVAAAKKVAIDQIFLVTQTTTNERLKKILQYARGYLYLVSVLGVTGERKSLERATTLLVERVKKRTDLPLAVGFGISRRNHVQDLIQAGVDGYIVGSALIQIIEKNRRNRKKLLDELSEYVKSLVNP